MKTILFVLGLISLVGCTTQQPDGSKKFDAVKTQQVSDALQPIVAGGIRRVVKNSPAHAAEIRTYFAAVGTVFCDMKATGNFSPVTLVESVDKIVTPKIGDEYIFDLKNSIIAIYKVTYGDRFRAELAPDKWPTFVAGLLCDSINQGIADSAK